MGRWAGCSVTGTRGHVSSISDEPVTWADGFLHLKLSFLIGKAEIHPGQNDIIRGKLWNLSVVSNKCLATRGCSRELVLSLQEAHFQEISACHLGRSGTTGEALRHEVHRAGKRLSGLGVDTGCVVVLPRCMDHPGDGEKPAQSRGAEDTLAQGTDVWKMGACHPPWSKGGSKMVPSLKCNGSVVQAWLPWAGALHGCGMKSG